MSQKNENNSEKHWKTLIIKGIICLSLISVIFPVKNLLLVISCNVPNVKHSFAHFFCVESRATLLYGNCAECCVFIHLVSLVIDSAVIINTERPRPVWQPSAELVQNKPVCRTKF